VTLVVAVFAGARRYEETRRTDRDEHANRDRQAYERYYDTHDLSPYDDGRGCAP
jgi:hypothetical protein